MLNTLEKYSVNNINMKYISCFEEDVLYLSWASEFSVLPDSLSLVQIGMAIKTFRFWVNNKQMTHSQKVLSRH